jgi:ubiquinone/menaquinone biosynthesis C-methylase UbiE
VTVPPLTLRTTATGVVAVLVAAAAWWRTHPSAMPYWQRAFVELPHPLVTRARLREALAPAAGSRVLEIGPGTGYYSLPVAEWLGPTGRLQLVDVQPQMLDHVSHSARRRGLDDRIGLTVTDARSLPFEPASFDAAYLVMVLGEIPDQLAALAELARVVRPGGRIVVGELAFDPHVVFPRALAGKAAQVGLCVERRVGSAAGGYTVLTHANHG